MRSNVQELELPFREWGGARKGAGRPKKKKRMMPHTARPSLSRHRPVHVTLKLRSSLPSLRRSREFQTILRAFNGGKERFGFRLSHFAVMSDHLHLLVEAESRRSLTAGLRGLGIRIARALNEMSSIRSAPGSWVKASDEQISGAVRDRAG